jgi:hypothetical protein
MMFFRAERRISDRMLDTVLNGTDQRCFSYGCGINVTARFMKCVVRSLYDS